MSNSIARAQEKEDLYTEFCELLEIPRQHDWYRHFTEIVEEYGQGDEQEAFANLQENGAFA